MSNFLTIANLRESELFYFPKSPNKQIFEFIGQMGPNYIYKGNDGVCRAVRDNGTEIKRYNILNTNFKKPFWKDGN